MGTLLPTIGAPSRYTHMVVKAKLPTEDMKVIVTDRFKSPSNIAVWKV